MLLPIWLQGGLDIARPPTPAPQWGYTEYFLVVGGGILATVLLVSLGFWLFDDRSSEASLSEDDEELDASTREELKRALNHGHFKRAGEILMRVDQYEEAGDHFARAGASQQAADAYLKAECRPEAIHYFKGAGANRQAARLYTDDEHWRAAAAEYVKAGDHHLAGKYYEEAGDPQRAARHYRKSDNLAATARNLKQVGDEERAAEFIAEGTGLEFREADDHFEAQAAHDAMSEAHGALRTVAGSMNKIANDLRLLASGPRNGLGEIEQPENQPGSSIMPGKVNPVVAESVNQLHKQVIGNDATVSAGAARGELELNLYKPVVAYNFLQSARLIANGAGTFAERFVAVLEANEAYCRERVERSMALATALNPAIGYDAASTVAKRALAEDRSVREVAVEKGHLTEAEADEVLDPAAMTERDILGED